MKKTVLFCLCLFMFAQLQGCAVYKASVDERSVGTVVDDTVISTDIRSKILKDDMLSILDISTSTFEGHVYLVGEYEYVEQKERAIQIAKNVKGVHTVTAFMMKKVADTCGITDTLSIRGQIEAKLIGDKTIWSTNVLVRTVQCHVVLLGVVGSYEEVQKSIAHARSVPTVRSVTSYLTVK